MGGMKDTLGDILYESIVAPSQAHSATSRQAAESIQRHIGPLHRRILQWMEQNVGGTDEQIGDALNIPPNTFRPRRRELEKLGRIKDSGQTAKTKSGRDAIVWILNA